MVNISSLMEGMLLSELIFGVAFVNSLVYSKALYPLNRIIRHFVSTCKSPKSRNKHKFARVK